MKTKEQRSIRVITKEIEQDWTKPYFGAVPYIEAMNTLDKITDNYFADDARYVVMYFLANAGTWRGEVARRIKAELNLMLKTK